ncbi:hypothetical protein V1477_007403 [Vespula maculifrons]|uniref:Uncharacterized protein n=1 Tax=Vespula maculifrons TaxID=7453 RepID=A0ABD2CIF2_VESMC
MSCLFGLVCIDDVAPSISPLDHFFPLYFIVSRQVLR